MTDLEIAFRRKCKRMAGLDDVPDDLWTAFNDDIRPLSNADKVFQRDMMSEIIHAWMMQQMLKRDRLVIDIIRKSVGNSIWKYALVSAVTAFVICMVLALVQFFDKPDDFWVTREGRQVQDLRDKGELGGILKFANSQAARLAMDYPPETLKAILLCERQGWKIENRDGITVCFPGTGFRMPKKAEGK